MFAIPVNDCKFIGLTAIFSCSQPKNENTEDIHLNKMEYKDLFLFSEQKQLKKKTGKMYWKQFNMFLRNF